jgi:pyruvate dehydrogenase kinase 2/3/4
MAEELPVRLAHRVKDLSDLPSGLGEMPSIIRVKEWYAQSFEVYIFTRVHVLPIIFHVPQLISRLAPIINPSP